MTDRPPLVAILDPHAYTERSARDRLARRRAKGDELIMREIDGAWYTGRLVPADRVEIIDSDEETS